MIIIAQRCTHQPALGKKKVRHARQRISLRADPIAHRKPLYRCNAAGHDASLNEAYAAPSRRLGQPPTGSFVPSYAKHGQPLVVDPERGGQSCIVLGLSNGLNRNTRLSSVETAVSDVMREIPPGFNMAALNMELGVEEGVTCSFFRGLEFSSRP